MANQFLAGSDGIETRSKFNPASGWFTVECGYAPIMHRGNSYSVDGLERLRDGRGVLVLTGAGTENGSAAELRVTIMVRRNLVEWLEESHVSGSDNGFAFRHLYRLTGSQPPAVTGSR